MTNAEHIRSMTDEELAEWATRDSNCIKTICDIICPHGCKAMWGLEKPANIRCKEIIMDWLKQPKEKEDG